MPENQAKETNVTRIPILGWPDIVVSHVNAVVELRIPHRLDQESAVQLDTGELQQLREALELHEKLAEEWKTTRAAGDTYDQSVLRRRLTSEWPEFGSTDGWVIPTVRANGRTAKLIDLAVRLADEVYTRGRY